MARDDPITLAVYAKENGLLNTTGWKRFKRLAKKQKQLLRSINQPKLKQFQRSTVFKFGIEVPINHNDTMRLDAKNGNTLWNDGEQRELAQIAEYKTFSDHDKATLNSKQKITNGPQGYQKIRVQFVYDAKSNGRRKKDLLPEKT